VSGSGNSGSSVDQNVVYVDKVIEIAEIFKDMTVYLDEPVIVEGVFMGWNGSCSSSIIKTRSDWIVEDQSGCIYVTGMIPTFLNPSAPKRENIRVEGKLTSLKNKPLLVAERVERKKDLP